MEENVSRMLNKGLEKPKKIEADTKTPELPKHSSEELITYAITSYYECRWYQFFARRAWLKIIRLAELNFRPRGSGIALSNLNGNVVEIAQSITQFVTPLTEVGLLKVEVKDELAVNLINKGIIIFSETRGEEFGEETVTIKASINIKK